MLRHQNPCGGDQENEQDAGRPNPVSQKMGKGGVPVINPVDLMPEKTG